MKSSKGAAGVDAQTIAALEEYGVDRFLEEVHDVLRAATYRPAAVLRRYIPKADGRKRPLGTPTVRDRVVQMAAKLVLEPIFEAGFRSCSYGFRPQRSATGALERLRNIYLAVLDGAPREAGGLAASSRASRTVDARLLRRRQRAAPPAWELALPGGCVMSRHERPPVSRVREIRMHGLKGGLAVSPSAPAAERG